MTSTVFSSPRPVAPLGIIASKLASLAKQVDAIGLLPSTFREELQDVLNLAVGLEPYLMDCTSPESDALAALARDTRSADWSNLSAIGETAIALEQEMLSGHVEAQFLKTLVYAMGAKTILEIGLFTGYSALAMAEALPADGKLVACEIDPYVARFARDCFTRSPHSDKIDIEVGPAAISLNRLAAEGASFDFVFIDADKGGYLGYFNILLDRSLLAPGGLICVDNTLMQGQPYLPDEPTEIGRAIAEFNRAVAEDSRVEQVMLPLRDGLTLIRRA